MTTPLVFNGRSPHCDLPFLFVAQAQKEATVNEALARLDALIAPFVEGESASAPASPEEGEGWIVGAGALDSWAGHEGELAFLAAGTWQFVAPLPGMRVFDRSTGSARVWIDEWQTLALPDEPSGGATVDSEARAAIAMLIAGLRGTGLGI